MALRRSKKATQGMSAEQMRHVLGQLTAQAKPTRSWLRTARSACWRGRYALAPLAAMVAVWIAAKVMLAAGLSWLTVLLVSAAATAGAGFWARSFEDCDRPWVIVPAAMGAAYLVFTAVIGS